MDAHDRQTQPNSVPYPNLPPLIDSRVTEYRGPGVTSSVAILGHPIHPIIVIFPIAFLSGAAGTDLGYLLTQDFFWARAGVWLLGLGVLAGIAAGVTGMFDFIKIPRVRQRRAGWAHMSLNIGALVLSIVNLGLRLGNPAGAIVPLGLVLSCTVAVLLLVSGWFGGELTFRHKVGIVGPGEVRDL
ncbi:DUF2231 domain-containing protein [Nodosilinea sp. PGN35]|uniref:DUF2231 domain-containing protein n=1 Tax=Nodosilinea sp. PGN35 TaxID=3020489 RepID=UPI0023B2E224|nr:DUF2231 domain-containing protein [Nodosilinea sp. TSF1-S3]MDF0367285.1 DUF2231 domain-containing protein [Nodosilinea sp. TSF1-S3]